LRPREEASYRGWILTRFAELGKYSKEAWLGGMLASSVLFGLVFSAVYLAPGRNLWASIVAHGSLDITGFVMMYLGVYPDCDRTQRSQ
jgi:membrane protease YdiL (CAAX protease family)